MTEERLQKIIAGAGLASRRAAEKMITSGRVRVNGKIASTLGLKADIDTDVIEVDGNVISMKQEKEYYLFYKPAGFLTTMDDPKGRPTIKEFLTKIKSRVYPVGRLDMDVEGLLILTNDGELSARLMHPSHHVPKTYRVKIKGRPSNQALAKLARGEIVLGDKPIKPAKVELVKKGKDRSWILLTLTEGRHRQVKRMCSTIGHPVLKLKRISFGPLNLKNMTPATIRPLTKREVKALKSSAGL